MRQRRHAPLYSGRWNGSCICKSNDLRPALARRSLLTYSYTFAPSEPLPACLQRRFAFRACVVVVFVEESCIEGDGVIYPVMARRLTGACRSASGRSSRLMEVVCRGISDGSDRCWGWGSPGWDFFLAVWLRILGGHEIWFIMMIHRSNLNFGNTLYFLDIYQICTTIDS